MISPGSNVESLRESISISKEAGTVYNMLSMHNIVDRSLCVYIYIISTLTMHIYTIVISTPSTLISSSSLPCRSQPSIARHYLSFVINFGPTRPSSSPVSSITFLPSTNGRPPTNTAGFILGVERLSFSTNSARGARDTWIKITESKARCCFVSPSSSSHRQQQLMKASIP